MMPLYLVTCATVGHEEYRVEADDEAHAQALVEEGRVVDPPVLSEVLSVEVESVSEVDG